MTDEKDTSLLSEAISDYLEAFERGVTPDREALLARHPEVEKELRDFVENYEQMERFAEPLRKLAFMDPHPPGDFGDYELLEPIGEGGMAVVYRARQKSLNRIVALKMMRSGPKPSPRDIQRFHVEAEAVMRLNHPQIIHLHDYGESDGYPFFTMQFLEGGTLDERLMKFRGDSEAAARLVRDLARAIEHAHTRAILHRDLKPGNILFDREDHPYVADWGLARQLDTDQRITQTGVIYGTPAYMAPEQTKGVITTRVDVYSLGVILYETLTGRVPFVGETSLETLDLKSKNDPELPGVDEDLDEVCLKCLEREPDDRYKSAKELADDLERWLHKKPVLARPGVGASWLLKTVRRYTDARIQKLLEESRQRSIRNELSYVSSMVADKILMKLKDWSYAVLEAANDRDLPRMLKSKDHQGVRPFLERIRQTYDDPARGFAEPDEKSPFESWVLLNNRGLMIACTPHESIVGRDFSDREWFRDAAAHAGKRGLDSVHVSRVFLSVVLKNQCKFVLSAPVYGDNQLGAPVIGVLGASFTTDSNLGLPRLSDSDHKVVVVGRWDPDSYGSHSLDDCLVLVHPAYGRGQEAAKVDIPILRSFEPNPKKGELRPPEPGQVAVVNESYEDPLGSKDLRFQGRWWAGIAPVGNTPFLAIVQRRPDPTIERKSEIVVGQLVDLTGDTRAVSEPYADGVQDYADWYNAKGGVNGKKVRIVRRDYRNRPEEASELYETFKALDPVLAIQAWGTGDTQDLTQRATRDEIPFLSASCSAKLSDPRSAPYNFIIVADYSAQLRAGLKYFRDAWKKSRAPKIAFVYPDNPYGRSPIPAGKEYARELAFEIVGEENVALSADEAVSQVERLKKEAPDFTWIGGTTPSTAVILKEAGKQGLKTQFIVNLWGNDEHLGQLAGRDAEGVVGLQASALLGDAVPGMKAIREAIGEKPETTHYVRGWVSMMVLCEALVQADRRGDLTGPGVKRSLELLRDFYTEGLTAPITYTEGDHRPNMTVRVYEISQGTMHHRETVTLERRADWLGR